MNADEYRKTTDWKRVKQEVNYEIAAIVLPLFLYLISLLVVQFVSDINSNRELSYFFQIPDGFFGGCIIFSFTLIQVAQINVKLIDEQIQRKIQYYKWFSCVGLAICIILSFVSVVFRPYWSVLAGVFFIYIGFLAYKRIVFYRSYLRFTMKGNIF